MRATTYVFNSTSLSVWIMYNVRRIICTSFMMAFTVVNIGRYRNYVHETLADNRAALMLLKSDVCVNSDLRVHLRHFDRCHDAEKLLSVGPYQRALFKLGEDVHICGHGRCHILYMDVTDRLTPIVIVCIILAACAALKLYVHVAHENSRCAMQCFVLPTNTAPAIRELKYE